MKGHYYRNGDSEFPIAALEVEHTQHFLMLQRALYQQMTEDLEGDAMELNKEIVYHFRLMELRFALLKHALSQPQWLKEMADREMNRKFINNLQTLFIQGYCLLDTRDHLALVYNTNGASNNAHVVDLTTGAHRDHTPWNYPSDYGLC